MHTRTVWRILLVQAGVEPGAGPVNIEVGGFWLAEQVAPVDAYTHLFEAARLVPIPDDH